MTADFGTPLERLYPNRCYDCLTPTRDFHCPRCATAYRRPPRTLPPTDGPGGVVIAVWNVFLVTAFSLCCVGAVWHAVTQFERRFRRR